MKIKIKKIDKRAVIPSYAHATDAGLDLTAVNYSQDKYGCHVYGTGLAIEIPEGYVGLLFPRSSISRYNLMQTNSVGVIDAGYRGEVMVKYKDAQPELDTTIVTHPRFNIGERIAQLIIMPIPNIEFEEVEVLSESDRGKGGYGSTGR